MQLHSKPQPVRIGLALAFACVHAACGGNGSPTSATQPIGRVVDVAVTTSADSATTMRADLRITVEFLRDACVAVRLVHGREGSLFSYNLDFFERVIACDQTVRAGQRVPLDAVLGTGLSAGRYEVDVNGVRTTFVVP